MTHGGILKTPAWLGPARSILFVPAHRPERIPKALASGADGVVVDLEDAVEPEHKAAARAALAEFLSAQPQARILVRINGAGTPEHEADIAFCSAQPGVVGIMLPKTESAAQAAHVAAGGKPVWSFIESAVAVLALGDIAAVPGVARLVFGSLDFGVDLGLDQTSEAAAVMLDHVRCHMLLHSRAAGLAPPLDGVYPAFRDAEGLRRYARRARNMGFAGMLCIHPAQVADVHASFAAHEADLAWAQGVVAEFERTGLAAFQFQGEMVDAPVLARARELLAQAGMSDA